MSLDGIIEFRVKPEHAAEIFVIYNDATKDDKHGKRIYAGEGTFWTDLKEFAPAMLGKMVNEKQ